MQIAHKADLVSSVSDSPERRHWHEVAFGPMVGVWSIHVLILIVQLFEFRGVVGHMRAPGTYSFGPEQLVIEYRQAQKRPWTPLL
jgi:hypothetical protein